MENYKSNSYKTENVERDVNKPVVSGTAEKKKKSVFSKFLSEFIQQDAVDIKDYLIHDVLIPSGKELILDVVYSVLGTNGSSKDGSDRTVRASYVSYNKPYSYNERDRYSQSRDRKQTYEYDTLTYRSRGDAEAVLTRMNEILERYKFVRVRDLYELSNVSADYTSSYYGWIDLRTAKIERVRSRYIIRLPMAIPIDER